MGTGELAGERVDGRVVEQQRLRQRAEPAFQRADHAEHVERGEPVRGEVERGVDGAVDDPLHRTAQRLGRYRHRLRRNVRRRRGQVRGELVDGVVLVQFGGLQVQREGRVEAPGEVHPEDGVQSEVDERPAGVHLVGGQAQDVRDMAAHRGGDIAAAHRCRLYRRGFGHRRDDRRRCLGRRHRCRPVRRRDKAHLPAPVPHRCGNRLRLGGFRHGRLLSGALRAPVEPVGPAGQRLPGQRGTAGFAPVPPLVPRHVFAGQPAAGQVVQRRYARGRYRPVGGTGGGRAQRVHRLDRFTGDDSEPVCQRFPAGLEGVSGAGEVGVRVALQMVGERRRRGTHRRLVPPGQHQQLRLAGHRGRRWHGMRFEHDVRVGTAEAERADPGPPDRAAAAVGYAVPPA